MDLAEQVAAGVVAADAVFLRIGPTHAAPDAALSVAAHAIGQSGSKTLREDFPVGHLAGGDIDVEGADVSGTAMGDAAVDDVQFLFVRREAEAVRLCEIINHDGDGAALWIDAIDTVLFLFGLCLQPF